MGDYIIDTPSAGYKHSLNVNLATAVKTNTMNEAVVVEIWGDDTFRMLDQSAVSSPPQSINWTHNFTKPTGGWPFGSAWCLLYQSPRPLDDGDYVAEKYFIFQNP